MTVYNAYLSYNPADYLMTYYTEVGSEGREFLRFLCDAFQNISPGATVLEFGGGPTIISLIPAARHAAEIHFCDYSPDNLAAVKRWLSGDESDFDWIDYFIECLHLEGHPEPEAEQIEARKAAIRQAVTLVTSCNIYETPPVQSGKYYDVVMSHYCIDAITDSKTEWHQHIRNLKSLLKPGGTMILSALLESSSYQINDQIVPNVYLVPDDMYEALEICGFVPETIHVESAPADNESRFYKGVIFASALD